MMTQLPWIEPGTTLNVYIDADGRKQGHAVVHYNDSGATRANLFFIDDLLAGPCQWFTIFGELSMIKNFDSNGLPHGVHITLTQIRYFSHGIEVTGKVTSLVKDISAITPDEKLAVKLTWDFDI